MSILINRDTRVIVQGIATPAGSFHARQMKEYGTQVVGGVTPDKGGKKLDGIFIFNTVQEAVNKTGANCSCVFVPAELALDAIMEAADSELELIVVITEGIPHKDISKVKKYLEEKKSLMIGPNCPGIITPGECKVGIMPGYIYTRGNVGVVSRSSTLTYDAVWQLTRRGLGQSTCLGIGADLILGMGFVDALELLERDSETQAVVIIGEIGGTKEEEAAKYIKEKMTKPVVGFVAGRTAPPERKIGHSGAIVTEGIGTAEEKIRALREAGVVVSKSPALIGEAVARVLGLSE